MKNVIIIGASGAIGKEMVRAFYNKGYNVFGGYFSNKNELDALIKKLKNKNNRVCFEQVDLSSEESIKKFFNSFAKVFGKVDVLVNCAGVSRPNLLMDVNSSDLSSEISINLTGTIISCKEALNHFNDHGGSIINIGSIWGSVGGAFETTYSATKGGVIAFSKALAKEVGSAGIRVNVISPGLVKSPINNHLTRQDYEAVKSEAPLNRIATAKEIAACATFLASNNARSITGQNIVIDAGFTL